MAESVPPLVPVLSVVKGIENETLARPSRIIVEALGSRPVAVLSGPGHAEELARGLPASLVVAGEDEGLNLAIRDALNTRVFRVYTNPDAVGVELAGALKNVLGIAAGICDGLGFGDNAKAALLTRGLVEMARFAVDQGARPATFYGLAGVGDVVTTCYSPFGRNRAVGESLGRGKTLAETLAGMDSVAEGVPTARRASTSGPLAEGSRCRSPTRSIASCSKGNPPSPPSMTSWNATRRTSGDSRSEWLVVSG